MQDLHRKIISMLEINQKNLRGLKNMHIKSLLKEKTKLPETG